MVQKVRHRKIHATKQSVDRCKFGGDSIPLRSKLCPTLGVNLGVKNKNPLRTVVQKGFVRSEADSNRCRRFCRPVTKPLIHRTLLFRNVNWTLSSCDCSHFGVQIYKHFSNFQNSSHFFRKFLVNNDFIARKRMSSRAIRMWKLLAVLRFARPCREVV